MKFTKMQGLGNDYVYVDCFSQTVADPSGVAKKVSDRHFGVGSDGLILICPSEQADVKMDMYNADGSRAQMCGNGIRCVGKYAYERGLVRKEQMTVETLAGIKTLKLEVHDGTVAAVTVDMGEPVLVPEEIPVRFAGRQCVSQPIEVAGKTWRVTCVSMGNPHAVVYVEDTAALDLPKIGPAFERHAAFPERINTEFVQVLDDGSLRMRVWERGAGETLACGTGACAAVVAARLNGLCGKRAVVHLLGGDLEIVWDGRVWMTGPAAFVFDGELAL